MIIIVVQHSNAKAHAKHFSNLATRGSSFPCFHYDMPLGSRPENAPRIERGVGRLGRGGFSPAPSRHKPRARQRRACVRRRSLLRAVVYH